MSRARGGTSRLRGHEIRGSRLSCFPRRRAGSHLINGVFALWSLPRRVRHHSRSPAHWNSRWERWSSRWPSAHGPINAPRSISIHRKEAIEEVEQGNAAAVDSASELLELLKARSEGGGPAG